ncbi:MAG: carboxypeptidase regulatory-like domain-containing protein [Verrucomicrobiales bacterium]|nr:carboxypeptidase regulatory-like domain-containing protein [Verrucomicrobiales bacterium]
MPGGAYADIGALEFVETATSDLDLVVTHVSGPSEIVAGSSATIRWTVVNRGSGTVRGAWHDAIALVPLEADSVVESVEVALVERWGPLGPGGSVDVVAEVRVPGGTEGAWRWVVKTNARGEVFEGRLALNNLTAATIRSELRVPELEFGAARRAEFAGPGIPSWFRFRVDPRRAFRIEADADTRTGSCRVYAALGRMPTESDFDLVSIALGSPEAQVGGSADGRSGDWYVLVVPDSLPDGHLGFGLTVRLAEFVLREVGLARAGNRGSVTVPLRGEAFEAGLQVRLRSPDGLVFSAAEVVVENESNARARFHLEGAPLGVYSVVAEQGGVRRERVDVLQVVDATIPKLAVEWILPERAREHRPFDLYLVYSNPGDTDLPVPRLALECAAGSGEIWLPGEDESRFRETALSFVRLSTVDEDDEDDQGDEDPPRRLALASTPVPASPLMALTAATVPTEAAPATNLVAGPRVLAPGASQRLHVRAASARGATSVRFEAGAADDAGTDSIAWELIHRAIVPPHPHPLWTNAWRHVIASVGSTQKQYQDALISAADRAETFGLDLRTEQEVLTFLIQEALEKVQEPRVSGRVILGDTHRPPGRQVVVLRPVGSSAEGPFHLTTSWYDGTFGVRDVPPGDYDVSVQGQLPHPLVRLTVGSEPLVDLILTPTQPAARLEGWLRDGPGGAPVAAFPMLVREILGHRSHTCTTDGEGHYAFSDLEPGTYQVLAADGTPLTGEGTIVPLRGDRTALRSYILEPAPGTAWGTVRTASGNPAEGAVVSVSPIVMTDASAPGWVRTAVVDVAGQFTVTGLRSGRYRATASSSEYGLTSLIEFPVPAGVSSTRVDLAFGTQERLAGLVRNSDTDAVVPEAVVWLDAPGWPLMTTHAGADGRFEFPRAPGALASVAAMARGFTEGRTEIVPGSAERGAVKVMLAPRGSVTGYVLRGGRPLALMPVLLSLDSGWFQETTTDAEGRYEFLDVAENTYHLGVGEFTGPCRWDADVTLRRGLRHVRRDLDLAAASSISGRCLASDGSRGLASLTVSLARDREVVAQTATDDSGRYAFLVLEPGRYEIRAAGGGALLPPLHDVVIVAGVDQTGHNLVASTNRVQVRAVTRTEGRALARAEVTLTQDDDIHGFSQARVATTDADGRCEFVDLPTGPYRARVQVTGFAVTESPILVPGGGEGIDIALSPGAVLRGVVTAEHVGVPGVHVVLVGSDGRPMLATQTDAAGAYSFESVPEASLERWVLPETPWAPVFTTLEALPPGTERTSDVDLVAVETGVWSGTVRLAGGALVPFASVEWVADNGLPIATTAANGVRGFRFRDLPVGRGELVAHAQGHPPVRLALHGMEAEHRSGIELILPAAAALVWTPEAVAALASTSPRHRSGIGLHGLGDLFAGRVGDFMAGEVWPEFFGGDYGMQPPQFYLDQQAIDLEAHLGLYEAALDQSKTSCSGVALGWDQCKSASTFAFQAEREWNEAYRAMRAMNSANSGLVLTRATVVALKTWKLALGIGKFQKLLNGPETALETGLADGMGTVLNADSFMRSQLIRGDYTDVGGWLAGVGTGINLAQTYGVSELTKNRLKIAGFVREFAALGKDVYEGYYELQALNHNVDGGLSAYLAASDNYFRALAQYQEGLNLMRAGLADCRTGGGTQAGPPPVGGLDSVASGAVPVVRSHDPNDKSSLTSGVGPFLRPGQPILYTIRFENVASASAPAQVVRITDPLDSALDWASFQPVAVAFNGALLDVPEGVRNFHATTRVATDSYPVDVSVFLDPKRGVVTWLMRSIDPVTGDLPEDPLAGFLPPNDAEGAGEGFVSFSIRPREGIADTLSLTNQATIVFDVNPAILTPTVTNRIDATPPVSRARVIAVDRRSVRLAWDSDDAGGSGVGQFDVFVARDGGTFAPWLWGTTQREADLTVEPGSSIAVYTVATDAAGNREMPPVPADVSIVLAPELVLVETQPVLLRWATVPGRAYRIERTTDLGLPAGWVDVSGPIVATGVMAEFRDVSVRDRTFYRLIQLPSTSLP